MGSGHLIAELTLILAKNKKTLADNLKKCVLIIKHTFRKQL
jgi:hypothetical protein